MGVLQAGTVLSVETTTTPAALPAAEASAYRQALASLLGHDHGANPAAWQAALATR